MKALLLADTHLTDKQPQQRLDDFPAAQLKKMLWLSELCKKQKVTAVFHAGDLFDGAGASHYLVQQYIDVLKTFPDFFIAPGQHDLYYHNQNLDYSPLRVLEKAGAVNVIQDELVDVFGVHVSFCGFGCALPEFVIDSDAILVTHRMITDEKLWAGQTDDQNAGKLLRLQPYRLILSGDNHKNFMVKRNTKTLVNVGSMMRSDIDQIDHKPKAYILDTNGWEITEYEIPISPAADVFNTEQLAAKKEHTSQINEFVDQLRDTTNIKGLNVEENFIAYKQAHKEVEPEVFTMLDEVFYGIAKNR